MDRMLRIAEVEQIVGFSKSVIYKRIKDGSFPKGLQISTRAVAWRQSDIEGWIAALEPANFATWRDNG